MVLKEIICRVTAIAIINNNTLNHVRVVKKSADEIIAVHKRAKLPIFTFKVIAL